MHYRSRTIEQIIESEGVKGKVISVKGREIDLDRCPLNVSVIPNYMGINLCSVDSLAWQRQNDGQLTSLTIYFIPEDRKPETEDPGREGGH